MEPTSFVADLSTEVLDDMRDRLRRTRWPHVIGEDAWLYGAPQAWLRDMVEYWLDEWDWAAQAEAMNRWQHHRVEIDFYRRARERADATTG